MTHDHGLALAAPAADQESPRALAGIGRSWLSVRLRGGTADRFGFGVSPLPALSLGLADDALSSLRHASGDGRVRLDHAVTVAAQEITASLTAVAEVPAQGAAIAEQRLSVTVTVTNAGPEPLFAHLWLAWSGVLPCPIANPRLAGPISVAAMVADRRDGFARFLSTVSGPVAGDRKAGSTGECGTGEPGILAAGLGPHGVACGVCSPDLSEAPLVLGPLAPGEARHLTWTLAIEADARAGAPDPRAPDPRAPGARAPEPLVPSAPLLSRRGLALTGSARPS